MSIQIHANARYSSGTVELWQYIEGQAREICVVTIIKKFVHQFLSTRSYFYVVLVIRQISYKRNVLIPRSWRAQLNITSRRYCTCCTFYVENKMFGDATQPQRNYTISVKCSVMKDHKRVAIVNSYNSVSKQSAVMILQLMQK